MSYFLVYLGISSGKQKRKFNGRRELVNLTMKYLKRKQISVLFYLFMVEIFVCELCFIVSRFTFNLSVLFTDNVLEERSSFEYDFAR